MNNEESNTTENSFKNAPFGCKSSRFNVAGIHPKRKIPGTFMQDRVKNSHLGPGTYFLSEHDYDATNNKSASGNNNFGGWKRTYELERMASMPYLLNKENWEERREQKRKLGPGTYNLVEDRDLGFKVNKGGMDSNQPRFTADKKFNTPAPGIYGPSGIPHQSIERYNELRKSASNVPLLSSGGTSGERKTANEGSRLGPGTYQIASFVDDLKNHQIGLRGPYDIFSGNRTKPIKTGHLATLPCHSLGPGSYEFTPATDYLLRDSHKKQTGKFLKMDQYPDRPFDRVFWQNASSLPPTAKLNLSPADYNPNLDFQNQKSFNMNRPGFLSSCPRQNKQALVFFTGNHNPVGPGRYDVQRIEDSQHINAHRNLFLSKCKAQMSENFQKVQSERLSKKNIPPHQKTLVDHISTEISPNVNLKPFALPDTSVKIA